MDRIDLFVSLAKSGRSKRNFHGKTVVESLQRPMSRAERDFRVDNIINRTLCRRLFRFDLSIYSQQR